MRRRALLTALAAIAVSAPLSAVAADDDALPPLTPRGFGAIKVGMTIAEAQRAGGRTITAFPTLPGSPCRFGRIARGSRVHALRTIRRGDKEADVRGTVTDIYAGRSAEIRYVEGCS